MPGNGRAGKRKGGGEVVAAAAAAEVVVEWEEWGLWNTSVVDEQMSWDTYWCPLWDMELIGEAYVNELYGEVVWDEDIWDLKAINHIPNP
ncbi:hypothetical protein LguiB_015916 [Lonicera macranthoides]